MSTVPVGLCGVFTSTTFVRGENAARSSSSSNPNVGGRRGTGFSTAPARAIVAA